MSTIQVNTSQSLSIAVPQSEPLSSTAAPATAVQPIPLPPSAAATVGSTTGTPSVVVNSTVITGGQTAQHISCPDKARARHNPGPNDHLRYAFLGAVAFQPAPPPITPRNETLPAVTPAPTPTTPAPAPTSSSPSALESLQETVKTLTTTMLQMMDKLKEIISGVSANKAAAAQTANSSALPVGSPLSRGNKFEWRAHSGHDGKLVILIPKSMNDSTEVKILSPDRSQVLATGRKDGLTSDKQAQVRFDQVGENYPAGSIVQFTDRNGKLWEVTIPATSGRYQY